MSSLALFLGLITTMAPVGEADAPPLERFEFSRVEMGTVPVRIVLYAPDEATAAAAAEAAFGRIRQLNGILSDYDPESELRRLCNDSHEGHPVVVSADLWRVLTHAQSLSEQSDGAFDITVGPVVRLWRRARRQGELPSPERITQARQFVGYQLVRLHPNERAVELRKPGMLLDLGGIAKGYAADEALAVLRQRGIDRALVDAGGDVGLGASPPDKPGWLIGVAALERDAQPSRFLWLSQVAIASSGDMWQYVEIGGKRYSHLVDPRTGLGLTDHSGVTVIAPDCITADGLASAVSVLGPERGLKLIEATPNTAAHILRAPHGVTEVYESSRWKQYPSAPVPTSNGQ